MLTPADHQLLADLRNPTCRTIGRKRLNELLAVVGRAETAAQRAFENQLEANEYRAAAEFMTNGIWLAACGKVTEEMIAENPRLHDEQKADLLAVVQLRYDAEAWREHTGFTQNPLPEVQPSIIQNQ